MDVTLRNIRRGILALVAIGTTGMCVELIVLEHYGSGDQLIPLVLGGIGLLTMCWVAVAPSLAGLRCLQLVMLLYAGTGIVGMTLHAEAGVTRRLQDGEDTPVPPLLSPAVLVHLGLLGLLYAYRHPDIGDEGFAAMEDKA